MIANWASRKQKPVMLLSTKAKYIAIVKFAQESKFTCMFIVELTKEDKSALIYGNNIGLLFLANNPQVSQQTKHINVWHHFLQELAKQKKVLTKFCRLEANCADVMTKKCNSGIVCQPLFIDLWDQHKALERGC